LWGNALTGNFLLLLLELDTDEEDDGDEEGLGNLSAKFLLKRSKARAAAAGLFAPAAAAKTEAWFMMSWGKPREAGGKEVGRNLLGEWGKIGKLGEVSPGIPPAAPFSPASFEYIIKWFNMGWMAWG
jgi:hypothetical protein